MWFHRTYSLLLLMFHLILMHASASPAISTANCNFIRNHYNAELQLFYTYMVEFDINSTESLSGMKMAIAHTVAQKMDICDDLDRPLYKVKTSAQHTFSTDSTCAPMVDGGTCHVVIGVTQILLDFYSAQAREVAYDAIERGLDNLSFLKLFAGNVVRAEFLEPLTESVQVATKSDNDEVAQGSVSITVAIVSAVVAFFTAALVCYGLMYEKKEKKPGFRNTSISNMLHPLRGSIGQFGASGKLIKPQRSFVRLEDMSSSCDSIIDNSFQDPQNYIPSVTWSVSDITSDDSGSIRSNLSRNTSKLESIIEEDEEDDAPRRKRGVSEFDCAQFQKGAVFISNLSQCQDILAMPADEDLEVGMAREVPIAKDDVQPPTETCYENFAKSLELDQEFHSEEPQETQAPGEIVESSSNEDPVVPGAVSSEQTRVSLIYTEIEDHSTSTDSPEPRQGGKKMSKEDAVETRAVACTGRRTESAENLKEMGEEYEENRDLEGAESQAGNGTKQEQLDSQSRRSSTGTTKCEDDSCVELDMDTSMDVFYDVNEGAPLIKDSTEDCGEVIRAEMVISNIAHDENSSGQSSGGWATDEEAIEALLFHDAAQNEACTEYDVPVIMEKSLDKYSIVDVSDISADRISKVISCSESEDALENKSVEQLGHIRNDSSLEDIELDGSDDSFFVDDLTETSDILATGSVLDEDNAGSLDDKKSKLTESKSILADNTNHSRDIDLENNTSKIDRPRNQLVADY